MRSAFINPYRVKNVTLPLRQGKVYGGKLAGKVLDKVNLPKQAYKFLVDKFIRKATEMSMVVWGNYFAGRNRREWEAVQRQGRDKDMTRLAQSISKYENERAQSMNQRSLEMALIEKYI
jgi:hypothetical protein